MVNIFVGNISVTTTKERLQAAFAAFGKVDSVVMVCDRDTGHPRGFAFVEMSNDADAQASIASLNGTVLDGCELVVNEARPKADAQSGPGKTQSAMRSHRRHRY